MTTTKTPSVLATRVAPAIYGPGFTWSLTWTDEMGMRVLRHGKARTELRAYAAADKAFLEEQAQDARRAAERTAIDAEQEAIRLRVIEARAALLARATTVLDAMRLWQPIAGLEARFGAAAVHRECEALAMLGRLERSEGGYARVKPDNWTGD